MNKYRQAINEKIIINQSFDDKEINIKKYVSVMNTLNNKMPKIVEEMTKEYNDMIIKLIISDKDITVLRKQNKELEHKLALSEQITKNIMEEYSEKLEKLKSLQENLDLLKYI